MNRLLPIVLAALSLSLALAACGNKGPLVHPSAPAPQAAPVPAPVQPPAELPPADAVPPADDGNG